MTPLVIPPGIFWAVVLLAAGLIVRLRGTTGAQIVALVCHAVGLALVTRELIELWRLM